MDLSTAAPPDLFAGARNTPEAPRSLAGRQVRQADRFAFIVASFLRSDLRRASGPPRSGNGSPTPPAGCCSPLQPSSQSLWSSGPIKRAGIRIAVCKRRMVPYKPRFDPTTTKRPRRCFGLSSRTEKRPGRMANGAICSRPSQSDDGDLAPSAKPVPTGGVVCLQRPQPPGRSFPVPVVANGGQIAHPLK